MKESPFEKKNEIIELIKVMEDCQLKVMLKITLHILNSLKILFALHLERLKLYKQFELEIPSAE